MCLHKGYGRFLLWILGLDQHHVWFFSGYSFKSISFTIVACKSYLTVLLCISHRNDSLQGLLTKALVSTKTLEPLSNSALPVKFSSAARCYSLVQLSLSLSSTKFGLSSSHCQFCLTRSVWARFHVYSMISLPLQWFSKNIPSMAWDGLALWHFLIWLTCTM